MQQKRAYGFATKLGGFNLFHECNRISVAKVQKYPSLACRYDIIEKDVDIAPGFLREYMCLSCTSSTQKLVSSN